MLDLVLAPLSVVIYQSIYQYFTIDLCFLQIIGVYEGFLFHLIFVLHFLIHISIVSQKIWNFSCTKSDVITEIISSTFNFCITFLIFALYFFKFSQVLFKHILWKYILKIWSFVNLFSSPPFRFYPAFFKYSFLTSSGSGHIEQYCHFLTYTGLPHLLHV